MNLRGNRLPWHKILSATYWLFDLRQVNSCLPQFSHMQNEDNSSYFIQLSESVQFSSVAQLCPTLCDPMDCSTPGFPVHHQLPELVQTHVHWVGNTIQPSCPLLSPSPPAFNLSRHQGLFPWVSSLHQMAKVAKTLASTLSWKIINKA